MYFVNPMILPLTRLGHRTLISYGAVRKPADIVHLFRLDGLRPLHLAYMRGEGDSRLLFRPMSADFVRNFGAAIGDIPYRHLREIGSRCSRVKPLISLRPYTLAAIGLHLALGGPAAAAIRDAVARASGLSVSRLVRVSRDFERGNRRLAALLGRPL